MGPQYIIGAGRRHAGGGKLESGIVQGFQQHVLALILTFFLQDKLMFLVSIFFFHFMLNSGNGGNIGYLTLIFYELEGARIDSFVKQFTENNWEP